MGGGGGRGAQGGHGLVHGPLCLPLSYASADRVISIKVAKFGMINLLVSCFQEGAKCWGFFVVVCRSIHHCDHICLTLIYSYHLFPSKGFKAFWHLVTHPKADCILISQVKLIKSNISELFLKCYFGSSVV